jgi:hypothetical protein
VRLITAGNPWRYTNTKPRCRIEVGTESSSLDLDRLHVKNLTECIQNCYSDANCQAVTFKYSSLKADKANDNCWLKIATTATRRVDEPASNVTVVSVFKPSSVAFNATNRTCEDVKKHLRESECTSHQQLMWYLRSKQHPCGSGWQVQVLKVMHT